jgi:uncharacterized protein (TIGR02246 family)
MAAADSINAQDKSVLTPADHAELTATLDRFTDGWKARDFKLFSSAFTEDAEWINIVGMHWVGREQVVQAHARLLATRYKGVNIRTVEHEETEIAPGVALMTWKSLVDDFTTPDGKETKGMLTLATLVMVQRNGHWLIRSGENVTIDPIAAAHDPGKN